MCPPVIECSSVNEVRLYTRTERSEQAVATMGCVGCGAVCHVREFEGGESVERRVSVGVGAAMVSFRGPLQAVLEACFGICTSVK